VKVTSLNLLPLHLCGHVKNLAQWVRFVSLYPSVYTSLLDICFICCLRCACNAASDKNNFFYDKVVGNESACSVKLNKKLCKCYIT
jgi:hypothetical protein